MRKHYYVRGILLSLSLLITRIEKNVITGERGERREERESRRGKEREERERERGERSTCNFLNVLKIMRIKFRQEISLKFTHVEGGPKEGPHFELNDAC